MRFNPEDAALLYTPGIEDFARKFHEHLQGMVEHANKDSLTLDAVYIKPFNNHEIDVRIPRSVREKHVYLVHGFSDEQARYSPNNGFMKLYLIDDALRNSGVGKVTYVLPHIPYQRKDWMDRPRVPISAKRTLQMLTYPEYAPLTNMITFDMHSPQIQGFAPFHIDPLSTVYLFSDYFKQMKDPDKLVIVAPDTNAADGCRRMAEKISNNKVAIIDKRRPEPGVSEIMNIVGKDYVAGNVCVIYDDMIDTGGTALKGAKAAIDAGATKAYICGGHWIASQDKKTPGVTTEEKFKASGIQVVAADTIPRSASYIKEHESWLTFLSAAPLAAEAAYRIQTGGSISEIMK